MQVMMSKLPKCDLNGLNGQVIKAQVASHMVVEVLVRVKIPNSVNGKKSGALFGPLGQGCGVHKGPYLL